MIRSVNKNDYKAILRLFRQLWPNEKIHKDDFLIVFNKYLTNDNYEIYCYEEGKIHGLITVSKRWAFFYSGRVALIEDLIVAEEFRRKGIGKELVHFIEKIMKDQNIQTIELTSDIYRKNTHNFWNSIGYSKEAYQFRKKL